MTHSDIHPPSSSWEEKRVQLDKLVTSASGDDPSDKSYDPGSEECDDEWTGSNAGKERSHEDSECPSDKSYDPELEECDDKWTSWNSHAGKERSDEDSECDYEEWTGFTS